tara:strand:- start:153 stop:527 length:375 start_codon:yes stop_codon:yes gene_type:complete
MSLRNKLIRLAHANPELREHILPLLKKSYGEDTLSRTIEREGKKWGIKLIHTQRIGDCLEYSFRGGFQKKNGIMIAETFKIEAWYAENEFDVVAGTSGRTIASFNSQRQLYRGIHDVLTEIFER